MTVFADEEVRAAAIATVVRLRDRYGGRVPRASLLEGFELHGQRIPLWNYQKGIFKPAVLGPDGAALSIQTSVDSPYADAHDPDAGRITYQYRGTDPAHPDNVAVRRAGAARLPLIYVVAVDPGIYDVIVPVFVIGDSIADHQFTLAVDQLGGALPVEDAIQTGLRRQYVTRAVLQRLHQQQFRRSVLRAYREQCAICHLRHVELLDAAHILPDRHPHGEPVVSNGLGLCKIHHTAYDVNIIGIDPDARIHVREDILRERDGPMLKHGIQGIANGRLMLPRRIEQRPNREFLAERFERFRAA